MRTDLVTSYGYCTSVARSAASNFYFSFFLLPREKRRAMCALYAFLRKTDDLGDSSEPEDRRRQAMTQWRETFTMALQGSFSDPILPAVVDTIMRYRIPEQTFYDAIEGVEMDLVPCHYETFDQLERYCYLVASVVGCACIRIWGFRQERALELAQRCGLAFQLTNILRDVKEDAARGRVYLPCEDLRRFGCCTEDLYQGVCDERVQKVVCFEIDRAELFYCEAAELFSYLDPCSRRTFGAMYDTYFRLLSDIKRRHGDVFSQPVRLGTWRKLQIAVRWAVGHLPLQHPCCQNTVPQSPERVGTNRA